MSFDPIKTYSPVVGYEIEFEEPSQDTAFVPLYIPEDTTPEGNETNVLYFKADIHANHLASYGGVISYILVSDPDSEQGIGILVPTLTIQVEAVVVSLQSQSNMLPTFCRTGNVRWSRRNPGGARALPFIRHYSTNALHGGASGW